MASIRDRLVPLVLGVAVLTLAFATVPAAGQTDEAPALSTDEVDAERLQTFAAATLRVDQVGRSWMERMQSAEDQGQVMAMQEQAQAEMIGAVEEEGLTVQEYNMIFEIVHADAALSAEVERLIQEELDR